MRRRKKKQRPDGRYIGTQTCFLSHPILVCSRDTQLNLDILSAFISISTFGSNLGLYLELEVFWGFEFEGQMIVTMPPRRVFCVV